MADATLKDLKLLPQDAPDNSEAPEPSRTVSFLFQGMIRRSRNATSLVAVNFIQVALHPDRFRAPEDDCCKP
jgi:hypothetical protein